MDTHDRKVIDVLSDQKRFIVPFYQRHYKWHETLWASFWDDVRVKAEEALDQRPKFDHYMGALILSPESYSVAVTPRLLVVDGQQRLTTFQLFLIALREVGTRLGYADISEAVHNYLFNRTMSGDVGQDAKFKLVPNRADRELFFKLADGGLAPVREENNGWFHKNGRIIKKYAPNPVRAVDYFEHYIYQFCVTGYVDDDLSEEDDISAHTSNDEDTDSDYFRLHALLNALLNHLKLVVITLGENDDAQVIFETLNSKSEPLNAMELVRNNIFQRASAESEQAEKLFEEKWKPLEQPFWHATAPRARPQRPRIDHFLSHALTAQTGDEVSLRELYAEYRAFAQPKGKPRFSSVQEELNALLRYAPIYEGLEGNRDEPTLTWIGGKLMLWEVTTAYPVVFAVAASAAEDEEKRQIYKLLNSYLVRRAVCGLTPKNLNKNFQRIVSQLLKNGVSVDTFLGTFENQKGDSVRFPTDNEFRHAIKTQPVYQTVHRKERLRDILWDLECAMRTRFNVDAPQPEKISIEHVMPQNWDAFWRLSDGTKVDTLDVMLSPEKYDAETRDAVDRRQRAVHTLGNLTLVTNSGNSAASNGDFEQKKHWLGESLLAMNRQIQGYSAWSEEEIADRADRLADVALQVWPGPTSHTNTSAS